jgi:hypothetical protein
MKALLPAVLRITAVFFICFASAKLFMRGDLGLAAMAAGAALYIISEVIGCRIR